MTGGNGASRIAARSIQWPLIQFHTSSAAAATARNAVDTILRNMLAAGVQDRDPGGQRRHGDDGDANRVVGHRHVEQLLERPPTSWSGR